MATSGDRPVSIDERLVKRIGVREWGLPTMAMPGQVWRSERSSRPFRLRFNCW